MTPDPAINRIAQVVAAYRMWRLTHSENGEPLVDVQSAVAPEQQPDVVNDVLHE